MPFLITDSHLAKKRAFRDFSPLREFPKEGKFSTVRLCDRSQIPSIRAKELFLDFDQSKRSFEKSPTAQRFSPSPVVVRLVRDSIVASRKEQYSTVTSWLKNVQRRIRCNSAQQEVTHTEHDASSVESMLQTREWIVKKIQYVFDNIGTATIGNGLDEYFLTKGGYLKSDFMALLFSRLGVQQSEKAFIASLRDDLWRAGIHKSLNGTWGSVCLKNGELAISTSPSEHNNPK